MGMQQMSIGSTFKTAGGLAAFIAFLFGGSYCSEMPKYRFEKVAAETGRRLAGARLVSSIKSGDLTSPASWFWPATTTWNFAMPDPTMDGRFYLMSMIYEEKEPNVWLLDVDCDSRKGEWYDLDEPATAIPARDVWGDPLVAPNGQTYRHSKVSIAFPTEWLHQFCDTDWTAERRAVASQRHDRNQP
jgi:hypothetical protein